MSQIHKIIERTECTRVLYGAEMDTIVQGLHSGADNLVCTAFVSLREILDMEPRAFPYEKYFQQEKNKPALVIHTSGTTGKRKILSQWRKPG